MIVALPPAAMHSGCSLNTHPGYVLDVYACNKVAQTIGFNWLPWREL